MSSGDKITYIFSSLKNIINFGIYIVFIGTFCIAGTRHQNNMRTCGNPLLIYTQSRQIRQQNSSISILSEQQNIIFICQLYSKQISKQSRWKIVLLKSETCLNKSCQIIIAIFTIWRIFIYIFKCISYIPYMSVKCDQGKYQLYFFADFYSLLILPLYFLLNISEFFLIFPGMFSGKLRCAFPNKLRFILIQPDAK